MRNGVRFHGGGRAQIPSLPVDDPLKGYDLTPFLSPELKVRFLTNNARSMENGDGLQWDNFSIFAR